MAIVDTHAHIYSEVETQYPPTDAFDPLYPPPGTGTLRHLRGEARSSGVDRVVVVHTSSMYHFDNRLLADTVDGTGHWTTGVCTLDPHEPRSVGLLEWYARYHNVRGLRLTATEGESPAFGHAGHRRMFEAADGLGVVVCALINVEHADALAALLGDFPNTPVVLDHCLNLRAGAEEVLQAVTGLASFPNAHAKLTFAVTGSGEPYPCRDTHDLIHRVIEAYGPDRCMWGSDFPCELWCPKVTYRQHLAIYTDEASLDPAVQEAVLGQTAMRLWFS